MSAGRSPGRPAMRWMRERRGRDRPAHGTRAPAPHRQADGSRAVGREPHDGFGGAERLQAGSFGLRFGASRNRIARTATGRPRPSRRSRSTPQARLFQVGVMRGSDTSGPSTRPRLRATAAGPTRYGSASQPDRGLPHVKHVIADQRHTRASRGRPRSSTSLRRARRRSRALHRRSPPRSRAAPVPAPPSTKPSIGPVR